MFCYLKKYSNAKIEANSLNHFSFSSKNNEEKKWKHCRKLNWLSFKTKKTILNLTEYQLQKKTTKATKKNPDIFNLPQGNNFFSFLKDAKKNSNIVFLPWLFKHNIPVTNHEENYLKKPLKANVSKLFRKGQVLFEIYESKLINSKKKIIQLRLHMHLYALMNEWILRNTSGLTGLNPGVTVNH